MNVTRSDDCLRYQLLSYSIWEKTFVYQNPRGGTLKFSVYIGEADFFGVKILNFRIFLGFQKN